MLKSFRDFMFRGNVIDLAVAVVIGAALGDVISAFVEDLLTPLIAAIGGQPDFAALTFELNNSQFFYGDFINSLISLLFVGAGVYFGVVLPLSKLRSHQRLGFENGAHQKPMEEQTRACPECLSQIPTQAHRCAHCCQEVQPVIGLKAG